MKIRQWHMFLLVATVTTTCMYAVYILPWYKGTITATRLKYSDGKVRETMARYAPQTLQIGTEENKHWRYEEESIRLGHLVQNRLFHLQNPPTCDTARTMICESHWCGFGCRMHMLMMCLMTGYATRRTVVVVPSASTQLIPLNTPCVESVHMHVPRMSADTNESRVVKYDRWNTNKYIPDFNPPVLPRDLANRIQRVHRFPFLWWAGQIAKYVVRPTPTALKRIKEEAKKIGFSHPIVGVHVRRTDKRPEVPRYSQVEEYMVHVEAWYNDMEQTNPGVQRKVFLATDEPKVIPEIISKYSAYTFLYNEYFTAMANVVKERTKNDSEVGIVYDTLMLSRCDFLVCTLSSNVCRLAYELMQTIHGDASKHLISVDKNYSFPDSVPLGDIPIVDMPTYGEFDDLLTIDDT